MDLRELMGLTHGSRVVQRVVDHITLRNVSTDCYTDEVTEERSIWRNGSASLQLGPMFNLQLGIIFIASQVLFFALRPLRQPGIVAEILCGLLLGPTAFMKTHLFSEIFPPRSFNIIETVGYFGLMHHFFQVGLRFDPSAITWAGKKATAIALAGLFLPAIIGLSTFYLATRDSEDTNKFGGVIWIVALTLTGSPVLWEILASTKLLHTDIGRTAISAAMISDLCGWVVVAGVIPMGIKHDGFHYYSIPVTIALVLLCFYGVRPALAWIIDKTFRERDYDDHYLAIVLIGVSVSGLITDAIGAHALVGAFAFGLMMPNGDLGSALIQRTEGFVVRLLLPFFYVVCGVRINLWEIKGVGDLAVIIVIICLAWLAKVVSTLGVSMFFNVQPREGIALGLLMNSKNFLGLALLNVGWDKKALTVEQYSIMVLAFLVMTSSVAPIIHVIYSPAKRFMNYTKRSVQATGSDTEFRVVSCVYAMRNVSSIINLLELSTGSKPSYFSVVALHLVELTGCASTMLVAHDSHHSGSLHHRDQAQLEHVVKAFQDFECENLATFVRLLTVFSPYESMVGDICGLAEDKRASLIILPFHRRTSIDGKMEDAEPTFRPVNQSVLANAPCSVALLVDRGLTAFKRTDSNRVLSRRLVMLFIGGNDDREALALAWRMSGHPNVELSVVRFIPPPDIADMELPTEILDRCGILTLISSGARQKQLDDVYMDRFRCQNACNKSVSYREVKVNCGAEMLTAIREMKHEACDLYIVGRGERAATPLTFGLSEWSEYPELGAIGDMLASSNFGAQVSVLVVQQYEPKGSAMDADGLGISDSSEYFRRG